MDTGNSQKNGTAAGQTAPQPAPEPADHTTPDIHTTPIAVAPEPARRSRPNVSFILLILVLALGIPGGYVLYQHSQATAQQLRDELARVEAERKAKEEAERKAKEAERKAMEEAERKAAEELARNTERFGELLQQMHAGLSAAQQEIAPAAKRVAAGQPLSEQSSLLQHFDSLRQTAAAAKSLVIKLSVESFSGCYGTLPADPPAFRSFITDFCCNPAVTADSLSNEQLLTLLGWDSALAEAKRKSAEVAQRTLSGKGISEWEYSREIISAARDGDKELLALLIAAGADVNAADKDGYTPLYWAAYNGRTECVKLLLAAPGIDVNKADEYGRNPLYRAAFYGHDECVRLLLAAPGIDVNAADEDGMTPLSLASWEGHTECVKLLLAAPGIDVNKADISGRTPLTEAAYNGRTECVKLLLAAPGIDVNKADEDGRTPVKAAESEGHTECARLIREAGGKE